MESVMKPRQKILVILAVSLLLSTLFVSMAFAQDPRPPSGGGGTGAGGTGGDNGKSAGGAACAALQGQVLNWGVGGFGGVGVELQTGSWQVATTSASDGNYGFGGLGVGVATVHVTLPPEQVGLLEPLMQDAGVYLNCDYPLFINPAVYSGPRPNPPGTIDVTAPASLSPGENTVIRLVVKNNLPTDITNVNVTDRIPAGLTALEVAAAQHNSQTVRIIDGGPDGQLVFAYVDRMSPGAEENFLITVAVDPNLATGTSIRNTASLFYRESAADQSWVDLTVGTGGFPLPAAEASQAPAASATPAPTAKPEATAVPTTPEIQGEEFVPPSGLPTTGEDFVPPPGMLPETGYDFLAMPDTLPQTGMGDWLPLLGFGLGGVAYTLHFLRNYWRNRK